LVLRLDVYFATTSVDTELQETLQRHHIPVTVGMAATADRILYAGAFGTRDSTSGMPVTIRSTFDIASMMKEVTTVAAIQLVEQGEDGSGCGREQIPC
jgi:CubicO group peptidase (beta-lactamase class C family)